MLKLIALILLLGLAIALMVGLGGNSGGSRRAR